MEHKYIFNVPYAASKIIDVSISDQGEVVRFFAAAKEGTLTVNADFGILKDHWPLVGKYYVNLPDGGTSILDEKYLKSIGMVI